MQTKPHPQMVGEARNLPTPLPSFKSRNPLLVQCTVLTAPYGTDLGGMQIWHEIDTNAAGQKVIRFPFSIPGMEP